MTERIRKIMEDTQMTQQEFAVKLGISPASLSGILNGRSEPTRKHAEAIHRAFPRINVNWLMFGEGEMFTPSASSSEGEEEPHMTAVESRIDAGEPQLLDGTTSAAILPSSMFEPSAPSPSSSSVNARKSQTYGSRSDLTQRAMQTGLNLGINLDKDERKIKEIRVFYSNGTYESFVPSNK